MKKWVVLLAAMLLIVNACGKKPGSGDDDDDDNNNDDNTSSPTPTISFPPGWEGLAPLPDVRQEHPTVVFQGEIWVFGGFHTGFDIGGDVEAYDPVSNTWRNDIRPIGPMGEISMHHANVAVANNTVYVTGFLLGNFDPDGRVFEYQVASNTWVEKTPMPLGTERGASQVAAIGDLIYVAGGLRNGAVTTFQVYDTVGDQWTDLQPLPEIIDHGYAANVNGVIYTVGGRAGSITALNDSTWAYDPNGNGQWESKAPMPTARGGIAGAVTPDGRIFVFGGEGNTATSSGVFAQVEAYDTISDSWDNSFADMPDPRHGMGAAELDGKIYIPGGGEVQALGAVDRHDAMTY